MEYIESDLDHILRDPIKFSEHHLKKIVYGTLCALAYLHLNNIMHRDLKPANILMTTRCDVKICDLGLARCLPRGLDGQRKDSKKTYYVECLNTLEVRDPLNVNTQGIHNLKKEFWEFQ